MKSIYEILKAIGVEVPEDKKADFDKEWKENYRTKEEYDKAVQKRDEYKSSLDDVQRKLDGFKDVDVEDMKSQISTWKKKFEDEQTARAADAAKVELEKNVDTFLADKKFVNDITQSSIRGSLMEALGSDSAKGKSIDDLFKTLITDKDGNQIDNILVDEEQQNLENGRARFTQPINKPNKAPGSKDPNTMNYDEYKAWRKAQEQQ